MPAQNRRPRDSPANQVYKPASAAPKQMLFPGRRRLAKTYGSRKSTRSPRQGTLTQMDFITPSPAEPVNLDTDEENEDEAENNENSEGHDTQHQESDESEYEDVAPKSKGKRKSPLQTKSKNAANRRRTLGDKLPSNQSKGNKRRKTLGDSPESKIASSSFHTQTITQLLSAKDELEDDPDRWQIKDSEDESDIGLIMETPKKGHKFQSPSRHAGSSTGVEPVSKLQLSSQPTTPRNRKPKMEIPSSQSPSTPILLRNTSPLGPSRSSPLSQRKSTNKALTPSLRKLVSAQKTPRDAVIQDSYSTAHSSPVTPTTKSAKKLRFDLPENKENVTPGRTRPKSPRVPRSTTGRTPLGEVPDSDAELEDDDDETEGEASDDPPDSPTPQKRKYHDEASTSGDNIVFEDDQESCYGAIGEETQAQLSSVEPQSPVAPPVAAGTLDEVIDVVEQENDIPTSSTRPTRSSQATPEAESTPLTSPQKENAQPESPPDFAYTQGMESQRLSLDTIHDLGPQTVHSDIVVTLHPMHMAKILDRTKTHELLRWQIPPEVNRVWIYTTKPESQVRYMCMFGPPMAPGEIQNPKEREDVRFNQGKTQYKWAHEILQVYELNNPAPLDTMIAKGWVKGPPRQYSRLQPGPVGELTANLRCAIFPSSTQAELPDSSLHISESQEVHDQIQRDVEYSTQHQSSDHLAEEIIPSSQSPTSSKTRARRGLFARPALPNVQTRSSSQEKRQEPLGQSQPQHSTVRPSQATTVSQISSSSPQRSPYGKQSIPATAGFVSSQPTLPPPEMENVPAASSPFSGRHAGGHQQSGHDSSLLSSDFVGRSQFLPESLVNDVNYEPPPIIWDSADEHSD